jgi:two-component system, cell cycle sensor histidine kinase and response regulator CckA
MLKTMSIIKAMSTARPRILLIDDDANVREVLEHLLASFGYECHTAADATSGLARFAEGGWDLLLIDIVMPGTNGWALVEAIQRRTPPVPIVLITGLNQPAVMQRARTRRLPVITKPFRADALRAVLVKALQEASSQSSLPPTSKAG